MKINVNKLVLTLAISGILSLNSSKSFAEDKETLEGVVVTAKANAIDVGLANSISIITSADIEKTGATSLQDVLKNVSGFNFTTNSSSIAGRKNIGLRGMDSEHVLILIDGERVSASDAFIGHSNFQSNWVSLDNIHKIEIIKGSGSVLYGSEAIGGVINIITKSGSQQEYKRLMLSTSTLPNRDGGNANIGSFSAGVSLSDQLYVTGDLNYNKRASADPYTVESQFGTSNGVKFEESIVKNLGLGISYKFTEKTELVASITNSKEDRNLSSPYYNIERKKYKLGVNTMLGKWDASFKYYNNQGDFAWNAFGQSPYYTHIIEDIVISAELQGQATENQYITIGIENHKVDYLKAYTTPSPSTGLSRDYRAKGTTQTSLYFQDNIAIGKNFLNIGTRFDDNSQFDTGFSPAISYVHTLNDGLSLTAAYTVAFLAPNIKQADDNYTFFQHDAGFSFVGNSNLNPETSRNIEIGIKKRSSVVDWGVSIYNNKIDNLISLAPIGPGQFTYSNVKNATIKGLEATFSTDLSDNISLDGSYNYMDTDDGQGNELEYRSQQSFKTSISQNYNSWTNVLSLRYIGESSFLDVDQNHQQLKVEVDSYTLFDLAINKRFSKSIKAQFAINNLTDETLDNVNDEYFTELLGREYKFSIFFNF